jgi:hypothetical protein
VPSPFDYEKPSWRVEVGSARRSANASANASGRRSKRPSVLVATTTVDSRPRMLPTAVEPNGLSLSATLDVGCLDPDCRWRAGGL